jgi:hypothetical protein
VRDYSLPRVALKFKNARGEGFQLEPSTQHFFYLEDRIGHSSIFDPAPRENGNSKDKTSDFQVPERGSKASCVLDTFFNNYEKMDYGSSSSHCIMACLLNVFCDVGEATILSLGLMKELDDYLGNEDFSMDDIKAGVTGVKLAEAYYLKFGTKPSPQGCLNLCGSGE